jgi:large subunit ribosomal protein L44e
MAKYPKTVMRLCPYCRKHTEHKVMAAKKKTRGTAHPMSWGSRTRIERRGRARGYGNTGKYSKPAKPKMTGKKQSKKTDFRYECKVCKKQHAQRKGFRAKKVEMT